MTEDNHSPPPQEPWSKPAKEVIQDLDVDPGQGLGSQEVEERRRQFGPNRLRSAESTSAWQILYLNLVTDVFPALALGVGEGEELSMHRPPRDPQEPILVGEHWLTMGVYSLFITIAVLGVFALALTWLDMDNQQAITVSFLTLAFAQLWHVFNMRDLGTSLLDNEIVRNSWVWGALALCLLLLLAAVYVPGLDTLLKVTDPGLTGWSLVAGASLFPLIAGQILKALSWGRTG